MLIILVFFKDGLLVIVSILPMILQSPHHRMYTDFASNTNTMLIENEATLYL